MKSGALLVSGETEVTCPACQHEFSLREGFAQRALEAIEADSSQQLSAVREAEALAAERRVQQLVADKDQAAQRQIAELRKLLEESAKQSQQTTQQALKAQRESSAARLAEVQKSVAEREAEIATMRQREAGLATRERDFEARVAAAAESKASELFAIERNTLQANLAAKTQQVQALQSQELELRQQKTAIEERAAGLELEVVRKLDAGRAEIEAKVRAQSKEQSDLEKAELQKKLTDVSQQLADAQRKAEQGSQQLQGEVLELALEENLAREFPLDAIEEVKKGVRGGDAIQRVMTRTGHAAGVILWETKRAKDFSPQWIAKLKEDMRSSHADVGVLVTMPGALPKDFPRDAPFALLDGVWIVVWTYAVPLARVLQQGLLEVHKQRVVSAGKGEKMEAVYDYVTSAQFAQKLQAVMIAFQVQRDELEAEKRQTLQRWARREKQLEGGVAALLGVGGEIQGLAQQALPELEMEQGVKAGSGAENV